MKEKKFKATFTYTPSKMIEVKIGKKGEKSKVIPSSEYSVKGKVLTLNKDIKDYLKDK